MSTLAIVAGVFGVVVGWVLARLVTRFTPRPAASRTRDQELNYRVRALETDLRISQRKAEELTAKLEKEREDIAVRREELENSLALARERDEQVAQLRKTLKDECSKTQELRVELTNRAEQTIRAQVKMKDMETELSVAQAGSTAVADEINRLAQERDELTGRIQALQEEIAIRASGTNVSPFPRDRFRDR